MAIGSLLASNPYANEASTQSRAKLASDMNNFLIMLTTQLKNQDPLSPMDSNEFTSQLVQFASVEQQITANQHLENLLTLTTHNQAGLMLNYVGRSVEYIGNELPLVDGQARYSYTVPAGTRKTTITITDASGRIIQSGPGAIQAGRQEVGWDGKDAAGNTLPDGRYKLTVTTEDGTGRAVAVETTVIGKVTGVSTVANDVQLMLGPTQIPVDAVLVVRPTM